MLITFGVTGLTSTVVMMQIKWMCLVVSIVAVSVFSSLGRVINEAKLMAHFCFAYNHTLMQTADAMSDH